MICPTIETEYDDPPAMENSTATRNACKLCTPLGACLAFKGVAGCIPFLHGSQGCSTYIRRYLISHFREPMDIAASNFSEDSAIFGGGENFKQGVKHVTRQYAPEIIGVATTCLSETIGEDMKMLIHQYHESLSEETAPPLVHVSTPSYKGTHMDGFHDTVRAIVEQLAEKSEPLDQVNVFSGMISTADIRYLKEIFQDFGIEHVLLPDYSDTMDGISWGQYEKLPSGGTPVESVRTMADSKCSLEFGRVLAHQSASAGKSLDRKFGVFNNMMGLPIGIRETDYFFSILELLSGRPVPEKHQAERGRLVDAYVDAHKRIFGKRVIVYGEEDLVVGLTSFLCETGAKPVLCASGGKSGSLKQALEEAIPGWNEETVVREGVDFSDLGDLAAEVKPDLLVGNSKGYKISRKLDVPLIRVGFPIHDRMGGQRILHLGYRGAQQLFDLIVNTLLEKKQAASEMGYTYL